MTRPNGVQVDMSFTTSGRQSRNAYTFVATADDNNAKFRCEAKNEMNRGGVPMTAEVTIPVQVTECEFLIIQSIFSVCLVCDLPT